MLRQAGQKKNALSLPRKRESRPIALDTRLRGYDGAPQDSDLF